MSAEGQKLTINDIEHRILRTIWNDARVHTLVNRASISCPNLLDKPLSSNSLNPQIDQAFSDFINAPKGVSLQGKTLYLSAIFDWYGRDFGSKKQMRATLADYIKNPKFKAVLSDPDYTIKYQDYNWQLNQHP